MRAGGTSGIISKANIERYIDELNRDCLEFGIWCLVLGDLIESISSLKFIALNLQSKEGLKGRFPPANCESCLRINETYSK